MPSIRRSSPRRGGGGPRAPRAGAIIECNGEIEFRILPRHRLGLVNQHENVVGQAFTGADDADARALAVQLGEVALNIGPEQGEERIDLCQRTRPVLRGKGKHRQAGDAHIGGSRHGPAQRLDPALMTNRSRKPPSTRPASIAVHDDRHMVGHRQGAVTLTGRRGGGRWGQTCMISSSLVFSTSSMRAMNWSVSFWMSSP